MSNNPNDTGVKGQLFGLPTRPEDAQVILLPVPWDVTVSSNDGTAFGPQAMLDHSYQIDLYHPTYPQAWEIGIHMLPHPVEWQKLGQKLRKKALAYQEAIENDHHDLTVYQPIIQEINQQSYRLTEAIQKTAIPHLAKGKIVGLVGGDHSTALGLISTLAKKEEPFGILQIDAHADLREAYQGFTHSHASIMQNALSYPQVKKLVQVGIRDYAQEEATFIAKESDRIIPFTDRTIQTALFKGRNWHQLCKEIINTLPSSVYISFDIDGLQRSLAPHTGTPVPSGLTFAQATYLLEQLAQSGRTIIGFDLCEVANHQWDATVGGHLLYLLSILTAATQNRI